MTTRLTPPDEPQRLYTIADAAKQLDVSQHYIRDRVRDGTLPYVDLGATGTRAKLRVRATDLDTFINAHTYQDKAA